MRWRKVRNKRAWKTVDKQFIIFYDALFFKYWVSKYNDHRVKFADSLEDAKQIAKNWR